MQIGADDALVAFHALRAVQKTAGTAARVRWQMNGFNRTPGATAHPMTARNLMGQLDGTNNPRPADHDFDARIFVPGPSDSATADPAQEWLAGGSYAVVRRIRMLLDDWEKLSVAHQERVIGRRKDDGAPLSGGSETTAMELDEIGPDGKPLIPSNAHARISSPEKNGGAAMLRSAVLVPRRHRGGRDAGRGAPLRLLAGRSVPGLRAGAAQARPGGRPRTVHPPRGERRLRGTGRRRAGRVRGAAAAGVLTGPNAPRPLLGARTGRPACARTGRGGFPRSP